MNSEQTAEINAALSKAQGAMTNAKFNRQNPHFKNRYADLASIIDALRKPLADNGLSITQEIENASLVTTLRHVSGQWVNSCYPLPTSAKPQEFGSALTYARRYSLSSLICISADDDDDADLASRSKNNGKAKDAADDPPLTEEQADDIRDLALRCQANMPVFLGLFGVESLEQIPQSQYASARQKLNAKLDKIEGLANAANY